MSAIDYLEAYLKSAEVESVLTWALHGAHTSYLVLLAGAIGTLGKPEDEAPAAGSSRREVAAWILARDLGWPDLVAPTVLRRLPSQKNLGTVTDWSLQVIWPTNERGPSLDKLNEHDLWRAAIFDALVVHGDRHAANYLAVPPTATVGVQPRLKLIDHGHAFTANDSASPFYVGRKGQKVPDDCLMALDGCLAKYPGDLKALLEQRELDSLFARLTSVANTKTLALA
jgi:hypothetical protein